MATGSPFDAVAWAGRRARVGQSNNAFIFPGVGLGALVAETREMSDGMFRAAAECLADQVSPGDLQAGSLFPPVQILRRVSARIAAAVVREAREAGLGRPIADEAIPEAVAAARWEPAYLPSEPS